jgi:hypothetical protein
MGSWADEMEDMPVCKWACHSLLPCVLIYFCSGYAYLRHLLANDGTYNILIAADSRTTYGAPERRTYNSTTGTYGGSSMGGQSERHALISTPFADLMLQVTLSARNSHCPTSHRIPSISATSRSMLLLGMSLTSLLDANAQM